MKRIISIFLLLCCLMMLPGCFFENREAVGIENIGYGTADSKISAGLIPRIDYSVYDRETSNSFNAFNSLFQSIESNAYYKKDDPLFFGEKEFIVVYFKYDKDTYEKAKQYSFENIKPRSVKTNTVYDLKNQDPYATYNSYVFYVREKDIESKNEEDAKYATFFSYNDEKYTLVFFGSFLSGASLIKNRTMIINDFPEYLKMFSEYYDFSK